MKKNKIYQAIINLLPYILFGIITILTYFYCVNNQLINQPDKIHPLIIGAIVVSIVAFVVISMIKGWHWQYFVILLLVLGVILRIGYTMYTHYYVRGHDTGNLEEDACQHLAYIWKLYDTKSLPDSYRGQFYHPPLYYILSALALKLYHGVSPTATADILIDIAKVVSCIASCCMLLVVKRLCNQLKLKESYTAVVMGIVSFMPSLILMGGRVNNDSLVTFFIALILLYTVKWYNEQSWANTILLALAFGFGIMSKISCGVMALFTGPILLYTWLKARKTPAFWDIFRKGILFLCICAPLALWYPIRNFVLFEQPLNYVVQIPESSPLYIGDYPFVKRFLYFPFGRLFQRQYCWPFDDYNLPLYLIRCSIFGEFNLQLSTNFAIAFLMINFTTIVCSLLAMIYVLIRGKNIHPLARFGMPFLWLVQIVFFFIFQLNYPFGCTMDYRYIAITSVIGAVMIAFGLSIFKEHHPKRNLFVTIPIVCLISLFGVLSTIMFCQL